MLHSSQDERTRDSIQDVAAEFEVCARRAVECLLNRPTLLSKAFRLRKPSAVESGIRCFIASGNSDQTLMISLGLSKSDLRSLFPDEKDEEMGLDAIGEMVNIIAGTLFRRPGFRSRFDRLRTSVPSFAAPSFEMEQARIVRGVLKVGEAHLILELAVKPCNCGGKA
ncbi:MAG TPA: hypothetical protein VJ385_21685 [Fibrobacteria bacterium]|nr:hypothetical protein [Fibrobacteria bacterium]